MWLVKSIDWKINNWKSFIKGIEKCAHDYWLCKGGPCIKKDHVCDTHQDCPDGSDEADFCHSFICGLNKFRCRTGECISNSMVKECVYLFTFLFILIFFSKVCDGVLHCPDGYDEENCPHLTSTSEEKKKFSFIIRCQFYL